MSPLSHPSREAAVRLLVLLSVMDTHMSRVRDARMAWTEIAVALGLDSTKGRSITRVASERGVSKQAISRAVTTFLRMSQLSGSPAWGLKSSQAKQTYARTNGRHDRESATECVPER
jgi:hypothetical protein